MQREDALRIKAIVNSAFVCQGNAYLLRHTWLFDPEVKLTQSHHMPFSSVLFVHFTVFLLRES